MFAICSGVPTKSEPSDLSASRVQTLGWHVRKKELVSDLQVLLQSRRLQVARMLPMAPILVKELESFRVKISASANETFESWRERDHDLTAPACHMLSP